MTEVNEVKVPDFPGELPWKTVKDDLDKLYAISDPVEQEYELIRQAQRYQIATEDYRRIFEAYYSKKKEPKWFKHPLFTPLIKIEKQIELLAYWCSRADFFKLLNYLGSLSIILALATIWLQMYQMAEQKKSDEERSIQEAWQTITSAEGHKNNSGRTKAIQFLSQQKQSLTGLDVAKAYLTKINLSGAFLQEANFQEAILSKANLQKTELQQANFKRADLWYANLQASHLKWAYLQGANLEGANLREANLESANFQPFIESQEKFNSNYLESLFNQCNRLPQSFRKTNLKNANLRGANLTDAKLNCANLEGADFRGTENTLTPEQIKTAENWEKALYSPDFCDKLGLKSTNCHQEK